MKEYHSALKDELKIDRELSYYNQNNNITIKHDINNLLPPVYNKCDIIYSEPAWKDGYNLFIKRAQYESSNYSDYLDSINRIIGRNNIPIFLIIGNHALKYIHSYVIRKKIIIHGYSTNLLGWNIDTIDYDFKTNYDFIRCIANDYKCVGDFCCGYGNTGKIFLENNKNFVMSDINGKCIYYVAKNLMGYMNE